MTPIRGRAGVGGGAADTLTEKAGQLRGAAPRSAVRWSRLLGSSTPTREICN